MFVIFHSLKHQKIKDKDPKLFQTEPYFSK